MAIANLARHLLLSTPMSLHSCLCSMLHVRNISLQSILWLVPSLLHFSSCEDSHVPSDGVHEVVVRYDTAFELSRGFVHVRLVMRWPEEDSKENYVSAPPQQHRTRSSLGGRIAWLLGLGRLSCLPRARAPRQATASSSWFFGVPALRRPAPFAKQ